MAPASQIIDLISSSPPPGPPRRPPPAVDKAKGVDRPSAESGCDGVAPGSRLTAHPLPADVVILSDDFDTTIDLEEPILADVAGNKRRRLSPPTNLAPRPVKRSVSGPAARNLDNPAPRHDEGRRVITFDPIEFTSSFDPPTTTSIAKEKGTRLGSGSKDIEVIDDSSDPFGSSPQANHPRVDESRRSILEESLDPFASPPRDVGPPSKITYNAKALASNDEPHDRRNPPAKRSRTFDPISSSAPEACSFNSSPPAQSRSRPIVIDIGDSSESERGSDDEFPDVADFDVAQCKARAFRRTQSEIVTSKSRTKPSRAAPKKSTEEKTREREVRAALKEAEKETKRRERQEAKEAKTREKERNAALAEVNKLRTDKKVSTPEMIVDVPSTLDATTTTQLETILKGLDVQFVTWESPVENVIKWRRKVKSRFNDDMGIWEPIPLRIEAEKHVLVILRADEFVALAVAEDLESHISKMAQHFGGHRIIYLLEGLIPWMRKNRNIRNRQFTSGVRAQDATQSQSRRRRANPAEGYVPEETIEDALLQLQVMHEVLIHHTTIPLETAQWIAVFTQHVSTIPYKKQKDHATLGAGFCMESGQVRTGDDARDTYVRMLQEIVRVTAPIAYGIAEEFKTVSELVNGLETGGPTRLEGIKKCANKDGAVSDRTVGQAVSRRMHKVFTGRDEASTDV